MNVARSSFKLFLSRGGNSLLLFGAITLFARWLDPGELGSYFTFLALSGVLSLPANAGIRGALEKRLSEGQNPGEMLGSALAFKVVALTVVCSILLLGGDLIDDFVGGEIATLLVVFLVLREFSMFYVATVRGELRVGETAVILFVRRLAWIATSVAFVFVGYGAQGLMLGAIVSRVIELVWAYAKCNTSAGRPSMAALGSLIAFSKYDMILSAGGRVYQWMDVLVIGFFLTQTAVGGYEIAWRVSLLVLVVSASIEMTLFPQISHWDATASRERVGNAVSTALRYTLLVSVPALVGSVIYAEEILEYLFGPEYTFAALVLVVLMAEKLFQSVNDVVGSTVRALDRVDLAAFVTVLSIGVNLVLSPILVVTVGIVGAAVATTLSWMLNLALHAHYLRRLVRFDVPYRSMGWYLVAAMTMAFVLLSLTQVWPVTSVFVLVIHVAIGAVSYVSALLVIPHVRNEVILPGVRELVP